jgi:hypothetical protein
MGHYPQQFRLPAEEARLRQALLHRPSQLDQQALPALHRSRQPEGRRHHRRTREQGLHSHRQEGKEGLRTRQQQDQGDHEGWSPKIAAQAQVHDREAEVPQGPDPGCPPPRRHHHPVTEATSGQEGHQAREEGRVNMFRKPKKMFFTFCAN